MNIEWTKDLEVGNAKIDSQHEKLIQKFNRLWYAVLLGTEPERLFQTIDDLNDFIFVHLNYEEKQMIVHQYPGYQFHLDEHRKIARQYNDIKEELIKNGTNIGLISKTLHLLDHWTNCHIKQVDKELVDFLSERKSPL